MGPGAVPVGGTSVLLHDVVGLVRAERVAVGGGDGEPAGQARVVEVTHRTVSRRPDGRGGRLRLRAWANEMLLLLTAHPTTGRQAYEIVAWAWGRLTRIEDEETGVVAY